MAAKNASTVRRKTPREVRDRNLRGSNLMIWNAAIYCTLGVQDAAMAELRLTLVYKPEQKRSAPWTDRAGALEA
jgi:hypothetical protein